MSSSEATRHAVDGDGTEPAALLASMPFAVALGVTLEQATAERVVAHLPWQPVHCTAAGILHGGALMSLADSAAALCAFLGLPTGAGTATTSSTTNLFRPVRGSRLTATSVPVHRGRSVVVVRTDLTDDRGRLVAQTVQNQAVTAPAAGTGVARGRDTRQTVDELLRRVADGDPARIAELYAEHVSWMLSWPPGDHLSVVPWIRQRSTRDGVAEHFRLIAEHHVAEHSSADVGCVLVDGADAVVLGEFHNMAEPTRRTYDAAFALHLTVENGLITRHHVYEDSLAVLRAFTS